MMSMLEVRNPWDGQVVAELALDDDAAVARTLGRAGAAFARWRRVPLEERIAQVRIGLAHFLATGDATAREVSLQMGKPLAQARGEMKTFAARAEWALAAATAALAPEVLPEEGGLRRRIEHHPLGIVLDIAAWNYPLLVPVNVLIPALLAGNVLILKHSELTPLTGRALARAFGALDVPDLVQDLVLLPEAAARLTQAREVAHVAFTGSVAVGRAVYRQAADGLRGVGLELGGKDPAYVAADADLAFAAENVVDGACYNAGQSCCAVERVYAHREVVEALIAGMRPHLEAYVYGDPLDATTTLGPLARAAAPAFLEQQVDDAVARGAKLLLGGKRDASRPGNHFPPTLLIDVPNSASVMQEESFGPIVAVASVRDDDEAVARMNDSRFGLTASVWTRDPERAERFARDVDAGTIFQNRCDYLDPALPWTGWGESGLGSTLSLHGFRHLTKRKAIHFR